ncbi:MAG: hypothetical protein HQ483_12100, partial [Rhodospirillales bacterium]|nr:hypothetical protein [Rhodospirillales bacterium]
LSGAIAPRRGLEPDQHSPGLPEHVSAFDVLRLIRDVGHEIGLTGSDIQHLDYLISHTRELDWQPGAQPIVYKSVCKMARERGITERQIYNRESKLHVLGCLTWSDIGNFRRTGCRDAQGRIVFAYGVNLAPLASMYDDLVEMKKRQVADLAAFDKARRQLSALRRRILVKITTAQEQGVDVDDITVRFAALPRVRATTPTPHLDSIISQAVMIEAELDQLLESLKPQAEEVKNSCGLTPNTSDQAEENFRHIQPTNNPQLSIDNTCNPPVDNGREDVAVSIPPDIPTTGAEHITLSMAMNAASDEFIACIHPTGRRVVACDMIDAAARVCSHHGISLGAWTDACSIMGRYPAAVAVLVIDRNIYHPITPIKSPGGVLRAMTARSRTSDLNLHRSLFGILERDVLR